jgi:hypothetical protein
MLKQVEAVGNRESSLQSTLWVRHEDGRRREGQDLDREWRIQSAKAKGGRSFTRGDELDEQGSVSFAHLFHYFPQSEDSSVDGMETGSVAGVG